MLTHFRDRMFFIDTIVEVVHVFIEKNSDKNTILKQLFLLNYDNFLFKRVMKPIS